MKFNLISLFSRIKSIEDTILFMQEKDLLKSSFCCRECDILTGDTVKSGAYFYFRCPSCHKKESTRAPLGGANKPAKLIEDTQVENISQK